MDVIGPIGSLLTAGMQIMNRYDYFKRNKMLFQTYIQIVKLWEKELGKDKLQQIVEETGEVEGILNQCKIMVKQLKKKFLSFQRKNAVSKFFKAKKINDDIDCFTNGMQNLMDILSFKIGVKNSENITKLSTKLDQILTNFDTIKEDQQSMHLQSQLQGAEIQKCIKDIAGRVKQSSDVYKTLEYHCRYPSTPHLESAPLKPSSTSNLEEEKTGCETNSEPEPEIRLSTDSDSDSEDEN